MELSVAAQRELGRVFVETLVEELAQVGEGADLFSRLEGAVEATVRRVGAAALTRVVAECGTGYEGASRPCECGGTQTTDHYATCQPQTVLGPVTVRRAAYRCGTCGQTAYPLASRLALPAARTSPLLQARLSLCCALVPFAEAARVLAELTGVEVSPKRAQLVSEALGTRQEAAERQTAWAGPRVPPARLYLAVDGVMYCTVERDAQGALLWREAKVGVFYTPLPRGAPGARRRSRLAPTGPPIDVAASDSHSYVVHLGDWSEFAGKVWQEGQRRGLEQATEIVVLGDGAIWITSLVATILAALPGRVIQILDIRHAEEHLWTVARACLGDQALAWIQGPLEDLRQGRVPALVAAVRALPTAAEDAAKLRATTAAYYEDRQAQMAYPTFRAQGYQVGSGLAESTCKRLIGQRAKGPGMHWTVAGAQAIATLRAAYLSQRWPEVVARAHSA